MGRIRSISSNISCEAGVKMKVLIVSDTHRQNRNLEKVLDRIGTIDLMIHLGDIEGSEDYIRALADCPTYMVAGNNDFFSDLPREGELDIGEHHVFLTHGHCYGVSLGPERLRKEAASRGADIAMFGHTHKPLISNEDGIIIVNPGSISYPRQEGRRGTFAVMELDPQGGPHFTINYV